ncbi:hypothetical protein FK531_19470 [Rhodococcus spelaei]|uniref:DUF998 domain-containing protein n=1 Tax=Rhodococcus spelaei TaxID=2546320 RepID=A0A541B148_9NOCA|nr:hypothetical protein [Rhodococcus spelaei]TQF66047.1 hypothetical protein FK531_19470 [Rhodococcus spelaei]
MTPPMRLLRLFALSAAVALVVSIIAAGPLVSLFRDGLHLGCTSTRIDGMTGWICPDGIAYAIPGLMFAATVGAVTLVIGIRSACRDADPDVRLASARRLATAAAAALVLQAIASVPAGLSGAYGASAAWGGGALACAGALVLVARSRSRRLLAVACVVAALASVAATWGALLAAPLLIALAALLLGAVALLTDQHEASTASPD